MQTFRACSDCASSAPAEQHEQNVQIILYAGVDDWRVGVASYADLTVSVLHKADRTGRCLRKRTTHLTHVQMLVSALCKVLKRMLR